MQTLGKGCLELLLVWVLAGAGLHSTLLAGAQDPARLYASIGGGLLFACAWGSIRNSVQAVQQCLLLAAAEKGSPPRDGKPYAIAGTIHAVGTPLTAPFSGRPCVIHSYELYHETRRTSANRASTESTKQTFLSGCAMAPCSVRSRQSEIRIAGFPLPQKFPEDRWPAAKYELEIREYWKRTSFTEVQLLEAVKMLDRVKTQLLDSHTALREDLSFPGSAYAFEASSDEFAEFECKEQIVPTNAPVCVIGRYSLAKGGLIPDLAAGGMQILPGDSARGKRALLLRALWGIFFAGLLGSAASYGVPKIVDANAHSKKNMVIHEKAFLQALDADNLGAAEEELKRGVSANLIDPQSALAVLRVRSEGMCSLLRRYGLDPNAHDRLGFSPLAVAVQRNKLDLAKWLIASGADVNAVNPQWGTTVTEIAYDHGSWDMYRLLTQSGGRGDIVEATKENLRRKDTEGLMQVIDRYAEALDAKDAEAVAQVVDGWPADFLDSVKRGLYVDTRGRHRTFVASLVKGDSATVFYSPSGGPDLYVEGLRRRDGTWKIRRESWDETGAWRGIIDSIR